MGFLALDYLIELFIHLEQDGETHEPSMRRACLNAEDDLEISKLLIDGYDNPKQALFEAQQRIKEILSYSELPLT